MRCNYPFLKFAKYENHSYNLNMASIEGKWVVHVDTTNTAIVVRMWTTGTSVALREKARGEYSCVHPYRRGG